jgi:hypothetical protein
MSSFFNKDFEGVFVINRYPNFLNVINKEKHIMKKFERIYEQDEIVKLAEEIIKESYNEEGELDLKLIEENLLKKILGGAAGFVIGPSIGRIIAKALGIEKGILYDMFTSRLVGTALGSSITNYIGSK